jgi:hypothetical protein
MSKTAAHMRDRKFDSPRILSLEKTYQVQDKREQDTQDNADEEAGDDGEVDAVVFALEVDVAGQSAKPRNLRGQKHEESENEYDYSDKHQEFGDFRAHVHFTSIVVKLIKACSTARAQRPQRQL